MYINTRAIIERNGADGIEILVQLRDKPYEGSARLELPGGRLEQFESLVHALRREVREETGLHLVAIEGLDTRIETMGIEANVECLKPLAVYQTLKGPVDSIGVYFRCRAAGHLVEAGDETTGPHWMSLNEVCRRMRGDPEQFSFVDRAGLTFYLALMEGTTENRLPQIHHSADDLPVGNG